MPLDDIGGEATFLAAPTGRRTDPDGVGVAPGPEPDEVWVAVVGDDGGGPPDATAWRLYDVHVGELLGEVAPSSPALEASWSSTR